MSLKAHVVSDSDNNIPVANTSELEIKDAKIKALENEVSELKTKMESLFSELDKVERKAYRGLGD